MKTAVTHQNFFVQIRTRTLVREEHSYILIILRLHLRAPVAKQLYELWPMLHISVWWFRGWPGAGELWGCLRDDEASRRGGHYRGGGGALPNPRVHRKGTYTVNPLGNFTTITELLYQDLVIFTAQFLIMKFKLFIGACTVPSVSDPEPDSGVFWIQIQALKKNFKMLNHHKII